MADLTPNHPAVKAANVGVQKWLAGDGPFDDDPVRLAHDMTAVCITAALPHLTAEDLRNTPAGRALMAEALGKVLAVHTPKDNGRVSPCCSCEQWIESSDDEACIEYPCPTVEAITTALEGGTQ